MKDIQELWNKIPEKSLQDDEIAALLSKKSISEVDRFKRLLLIENYISWGLAIVIFFVQKNVGKEIVTLVYVTVFLGSLLNTLTIINLKKLQVLDDVKSFLTRALKVLKAFVTGFVVTIQIIVVFVIISFKLLTNSHLSWVDWLSSEQGISLIVTLFIIELILISYAWIFYIKRIFSLKMLLREMES